MSFFYVVFIYIQRPSQSGWTLPRGVRRAEGISMQHEKHFYIDGKWVDPIKPALLDVIDPSTEEAFTQIAVASAAAAPPAAPAARPPSPPFPPPTPTPPLHQPLRTPR